MNDEFRMMNYKLSCISWLDNTLSVSSVYSVVKNGGAN
jgi:hypothetical protein